ncbi:MAG TPA: DUF1552 domain-containing protein [Gemmataceae bacterium]|jgi:hypothetical protein|nr:DUF1552 domain-containing protein [Gemmataceae bacterium]
MTKSLQISRRTVLKGLGTAVALPVLEAMSPALALAGAAKKAFPRRMACIFIPNGVHMAAWTPKDVGNRFELPSALEPLKPFRDQLMVLSNLALDKARPHGDGPGDHARAMAAFLTGCQPRKTHGANIHAGVSVDQVAALSVGKHTRFPSLELGCDRGMNSGNCDSGYSCAYSANISWRTPSMPMAKEINPRLVFERLFAGEVKGEAAAARAKRERYKMSILDFVMEDAGRLKGRLGSHDQRKLDEYLSSVRELEVRIVGAGQGTARGNVKMPMPAGIPIKYDEHIRVMSDLLVLAFQGDVTRIATFVFANDGDNRSYRFIGVPEGHHDLSHHGGNPDKQEKLRRINRFHLSQLAHLLGKLKAVREGEGTLLDNSMIVYGSGISDGNAHNHDHLPILLAGTGGGTIRSGRHVRLSSETPLTNLYVSMLERMGAATKSFGDSSGPLTQLAE